jgi:Peptidase family M28
MSAKVRGRRWLGQATVALVLTLALACRGSSASPEMEPTPVDSVLVAEVRADVAFLAAREREGRGVGSIGSAAAARFIVERYRVLGLEGAFHDGCSRPAECTASYTQSFVAEGARARNLAALVRGTDSSLASQFIVVGAHYDHLGLSPSFSNDARLGVAIRPGADDNASGTAAVMELARRFAAQPAARSILFVHFDAEELGMLGSELFVRFPPTPIESMSFMLNLDMVGRLRRRDLLIDASGASAALREMADSVARAKTVRAAHWRGSTGRSDHATFAAAHVPTIMLTSGEHPDYHRVTDIAARIDVNGMLRVIDVAEGIVRAAASPGRVPRMETHAAP